MSDKEDPFPFLPRYKIGNVEWFDFPKDQTTIKGNESIIFRIPPEKFLTLTVEEVLGDPTK
jgi:hypothetical protein